MSYDWSNGSRASAHGGNPLSVEDVLMDQRFSAAVSHAIREASTMRSTFTQSSIDPRAIIPVPAMGTIPDARNRYEGMIIDYYPSGAVGSGPVWHLVRRGAVWAYIGGAPLVSSVDASQAVTGTTTPTALTDSSVSVPAGLYSCTGHLGMVIDTGGGFASAGVGSSTDAASNDNGWATGTTAGVPGSGHREVTIGAGGGTVQLYGWPGDVAHTATFIRRRLVVTPVEIRA